MNWHNDTERPPEGQKVICLDLDAFSDGHAFVGVWDGSDWHDTERHSWSSRAPDFWTELPSIFLNANLDFGCEKIEPPEADPRLRELAKAAGLIGGDNVK